jgi:hypothetical protein
MSATAGSTTLDAEQQALLHWLGHFYLRSQQPRRALALLMLAARGSRDAALLAALVHALTANRLHARARQVLDWMRTAVPEAAAQPVMRLLEARALLGAGDTQAARAAFRAFLAARTAQQRQAAG